MNKQAQNLSEKLWNNVKSPRGVIQIISGPENKIDDFDRFAKFLNKNGFIVFGNKTDTIDESRFAIELKTLKFLKKTYKLPLFLFGNGYGSLITQQIIGQDNLCAGGVCLSGGARYSKLQLWIWQALTWIGKKIQGKDAPARFFDFLSPIHSVINSNNNQYITYETCFRMLKCMMNINYDICNETPLLIIGGGNDIYAMNGRLARSLYNAYRERDLENLTLIIYPDSKNNVLSDNDWQQVQDDILDFLTLAL